MAGNTADLELSYYIDPVTGQVVWVTSVRTTFNMFTTGAEVSDALEVTADNTPVTYSIETGVLPTGLELNTSSGIIEGTANPTQAESDTETFFTVRATDMAGNTADLELSYYIDPVTGQVVWVTPAGTLGTLNAHEITLSASITSTLDANSSYTPVTYQLTP